MPTCDFIDIGDVLSYEMLKGIITELDMDADTCSVLVVTSTQNGADVSMPFQHVPIFYHCEPNSKLRDNGAIQDAATGFAVGDPVVVMKKRDGSVVKVVAHIDGVRKCSGKGNFFIFYHDTSKSDVKQISAALCKLPTTINEIGSGNDSDITVVAKKDGDGFILINSDITPAAMNPVTWGLKRFRHNVMTNGTRVERDLYFLFTSLYYSPNPMAGWINFATANPGFPLVSNNLNTYITMNDTVMADLQRVNYSVNHSHTYYEPYPPSDLWKIMSPGDTGDCKDYALTKAKALLDLGYPASALHIECSEIEPTVPPTPNQPGHGWLVVQTNEGDYALDLNTDDVVSNASLAFAGREFISRRRQIGSNWAFISPFSAVSTALNAPLGYCLKYILDPLLNILYPLPCPTCEPPFLYPSRVVDDTYNTPTANWYDGFASPSINFSEDNNSIYYATEGTIYTYRLDENVLALVKTEAYVGNGFVGRDGKIVSTKPPAALASGIDWHGLVPQSWWWVIAAEVISAEGYYDYRYQYYNWFEWPTPPIQQ